MHQDDGDDEDEGNDNDDDDDDDDEQKVSESPMTNAKAMRRQCSIIR